MMTMCSTITVSNSICYNNEPIIILFYLTAGSTVEPTMRVSMLSSRDTVSNIVITLSFNVTFGPPSHVFCRHKTTAFLNARDHPNLTREVIRSQYVSSSQPDMTRITIKVVQSVKEVGTYTCQVTIEGRVNIVSGNYNFDSKGSRAATITITGECLTALFILTI